MRRITAALFAVVLCFSTTADAFGMDPCPHHGVPERAADVQGAAAAAPMQMPMSQHAMSHDMAGDMPHGAAPAHHTPTDHKTGHDAHHGVCTCSVACDTVVAVAVPQATLPAFALVIAAATPYFATQTVNRPSLTLDLLPYGIAPPVAHTLA